MRFYLQHCIIHRTAHTRINIAYTECRVTTASVLAELSIQTFIALPTIYYYIKYIRCLKQDLTV